MYEADPDPSQHCFSRVHFIFKTRVPHDGPNRMPETNPIADKEQNIGSKQLCLGYQRTFFLTTPFISVLIGTAVCQDQHAGQEQRRVSAVYQRAASHVYIAAVSPRYQQLQAWRHVVQHLYGRRRRVMGPQGRPADIL